VVSMEDQQPVKTTIDFEYIVHLEEPISEFNPHASSSSEDNTSRYRILVRKLSTRPQNKFRLKSKAVNKPVIIEKVIIIDEYPIKPIRKTSIRKKKPVTNPEKDKSKQCGLIINKKIIIGKNRVLTRKQGKKDIKIPNPKIGYEGNETKCMQTQCQSNRTRKNSL
jgi:hypothetical protein